MLVRTFEQLVMDVRKRLPRMALSQIQKRGYEKLRDYLAWMEALYHQYNVIRRKGVNLFGGAW